MTSQPSERIHYLDAARAFALLLGILFHASISYYPFPIPWVVSDSSGSLFLAMVGLISHSFRMELFFLLAGFFSHMIFHKKGAKPFIQTRLIRIGIPFVIGWGIARFLIVAAGFYVWAPPEENMNFMKSFVWAAYSMVNRNEGFLTGTHLWFLYYLLLITGSVLLLRFLFLRLIDKQGTIRTQIDSTLERGSRSPFFFVALVLISFIPLWFMSEWSIQTPDQSLIPFMPTLLLYAFGFSLGWLLHRNKQLLPILTKLSWKRGLLILFSILVVMALAEQQFSAGGVQYKVIKFIHNLAYCTMMWGLVFGTIGLFRKYFSQPKSWVRYISDSSYWLYLAHLPIVMWLQVLTSKWHLHWTVEFSFIIIATMLPLFLSYHFLVRGTWIGQLLNGKKH